ETVSSALPFTPADANAFAWIDQISAKIGAHSSLELWKSGAYLLNLMDDYDLKRKVREAIADGGQLLTDTLKSDAARLFSSEMARQYQPIDFGNAKLRVLLNQYIDNGAWRLLWMPAALPYYQPRGAYADPRLRDFTKALVFSSWQLAPKTIAVLA